MISTDRSSEASIQMQMPAPIFWKRFLTAIAIGKGAIVGATLVLAILGALDIAFALVAQEWLRSVKTAYLDYLEVAMVGGGVVGATFSLIFNR